MSVRAASRLLGGALTASLIGAGPLWAFCIVRNTGVNQRGQTICCSGDPRNWFAEDLPLAIVINDSTRVEAQGAIRNALATWSQVPSSFFAFADSGLTEVNSVRWDGVNIVSFDVAGANFGPPGSNIIAFSACTSLGGGPPEDPFHAVDCDVIFNARDFTFSADPGPGELDAESITAHEIGHDAGLDHPGGGRDNPGLSSGCGRTFEGATLYGFASGGDLGPRTLELDDMAGLAQLYPRWFARGQVTDATTELPLFGAEVLVQGAAVPRDTVIRGEIPAVLPGDGEASPTYVGGPFSVDTLAVFRVPAVDPEFTVIVSAVGYYSDTASLTLTDRDTLIHDVALTPTARGALQGTVRDAGTGVGIRAGVVLLLNGAAYDTALTDPETGAYSFPDLPVSNPPVVVYTGIQVIALLPYPGSTTIPETIPIGPGGPTTLDVPLRAADVLLVDDDEADDLEGYYISLLDTLGLAYAHFDVVERPRGVDEVLNLFPATTTVLWFTGRAVTGTLSPAEQESLAIFLDRGGTLFLTGQNIAEELAAAGSPFLSDYLHVGWERNAPLAFGRGLPGDAIGRHLPRFITTGVRGANNQTSRDALLPDSVAVPFVVYTSTPDDTVSRGAAAVHVEGPPEAGWRIVFLGFGLEAVNRSNLSDTTLVTRRQVLERSLDWLSGAVGIGGDRPRGGRSGLPRAFALGANYPNPFNPRTVIPFVVPAREAKAPDQPEAPAVTLRIYSVRGELVRTLAAGPLTPGEHRVAWDGMDEAGQPVGSGVYFYRLESGGFSSTRKMVLLR